MSEPLVDRWLQTYFLPFTVDLYKCGEKICFFFQKQRDGKRANCSKAAPTEMIGKLMLFYCVKAVSLAENERNAPNTRKSNDRIYDPADDGHRTAADPSDDIKIEDSYASPVESSDHRENKSYSVYYHHGFLPSAPMKASYLPSETPRFHKRSFSLPEMRAVIILLRK